MSIKLVIKTRFTFTDVARGRKRDVKIEPGNYQMERIGNPLNPKHLPWLVIAGTRTGLAESFIRQRKEFTLEESADAPSAGGKKGKDKRDKRSRKEAPVAEAAVVTAPVAAEETPVPAQAEPVVEVIPEPIAPPVDLDVLPLEPLSEADMSRVAAFLNAHVDLVTLVAKVDPTVAAKPDIAANRKVLGDLQETLRSANSLDKELRGGLEKAKERIKAQESKLEAEGLSGECVVTTVEAVMQRNRKAESTLKGMRTKAAKIARALRDIPVKRTEALAQLPEAMGLIPRTCRWLRNRQADFLRKRPAAAPAPEQAPQAPIVTAEVPQSPQGDVGSPAATEDHVVPKAPAPVAPNPDDDLRDWATANGLGPINGHEDLAIVREMRGH